MTEQLRQMFFNNIELLDMTDKAVLCFREQNYLQALEYMPRISEGMRSVLDGILSNPEYFELVSADSLIEMLEGILEASRCMDYVLLADLLELQLSSLLCNVQELIMKKEETTVFDAELYQARCLAMCAAIRRAGKDNMAEDVFEQPLLPEELLRKGYRVEYTSCGLMTVAVGTGNGSRYLHSNHKVLREAYLLARAWKEDGKETYFIKGFGMGYHIRELARLVPDAKIEVYERDAEVLKLACAFAPVGELLENERISVVYDPSGRIWEVQTAELSETEKACIHMPSV